MHKQIDLKKTNFNWEYKLRNYPASRCEFFAEISFPSERIYFGIVKTGTHLPRLYSQADFPLSGIPAEAEVVFEELYSALPNYVDNVVGGLGASRSWLMKNRDRVLSVYREFTSMFAFERHDSRAS
jgi:hypothetical protein